MPKLEAFEISSLGLYPRTRSYQQHVAVLSFTYSGESVMRISRKPQVICSGQLLTRRIWLAVGI